MIESPGSCLATGKLVESGRAIIFVRLRTSRGTLVIFLRANPAIKRIYRIEV